MAENWYPIIDKTKCIQCQVCYNHCCKKVYSLDDGQPIVTNPMACVKGSHGCGSLCPTGAIHYFGDQTGWVPPAEKGTKKEEKKMKIQALGGCCQKSMKNYENAVAAVKELGLDVVVEHVMDMDQIMNLGVMATPGLVINGKVCAAGRLLTVSQIKDFIKQVGEKSECDCGSGCDCGSDCGCSSGKCGC